MLDILLAFYAFFVKVYLTIQITEGKNIKRYILTLKNKT